MDVEIKVKEEDIYEKCDLDSSSYGDALVKTEIIVNPNFKVKKEETFDISCDVQYDSINGNIKEETFDSMDGSAEACDDVIDESAELSQKKKNHICTICNFKTSYKQRLQDHMNTHTGERPFSCNLCDYSCKASSTLSKHKKCHKNVYNCHICEDTFFRINDLRRHIRTHEKLKCTVCSFTSGSRTSLKFHRRLHEKEFKCNLCDFESIDVSLYEKHMELHDGNSYSCDVCDFRTKHRPSLKLHISIHTGEKQFSCELCNFSTNQRSTMMNHKKNHPPPLERLSCERCDYSTASAYAFKKHLENH